MSDQTTAPLALVTGAARGIGADVAGQLAEHGYEVMVAARSIDVAAAAAAALHERGLLATAMTLDIADRSSVDALTSAIGDRPLAVLVNNAAAFADWGETASAADLDGARQVVETNLFGTWAVTQAALPALRRSGNAVVVNVGSGSGSHAEPQFGMAVNPVAASYSISKAAVHALTAKLAVELGDDGVRVVAVDPGLTATAPGMEAMGARPVADGARSIVTAVLDAEAAPNGSFTRDGRPLPW